ncbi:MAG: hypothetical protein HGA66_01410 [Holophaga sp.]|nr:hypothetical protein [Holophaga sp.]
MSRMTWINNVKYCLVTSIILFASTIGLSQDGGHAKDRSGTEIFSIITSEIKTVRFEGLNGILEVTRSVRGGQDFVITAHNKSGQPCKVPALSRKVIRNLINGFSEVMALRKVQPSISDKPIGKVVIQDFSDLEPAELEFWESATGRVLLRLNSNECYRVGLPLVPFKSFRRILQGCR